ncbi:metallophosphoesterase [Caminibacter mediatlanticus TB-2]|uniref:Metallophosphoesterase n=1 Tax=Caminibacter mediatlanticus TB-2 TaxID=391592 RepID=A0ABX5V8I8_9BACT|nr:metallophosphoesterase [Caminibacter mediatlanticus]QCT94553.1 metallophosphoesterase [Caminibacter mediatlanticus TB-2]
MILLRSEWKNIIAQNILRFAENNPIVKGSISVKRIVLLKDEIRFDKFLEGDDELKYDFCKELKLGEKRKEDKELFKELDFESKKALFKSVISKFFDDKVCYFRNNMIVFPARFSYKKMDKRDYFKVNTIKLVAKKNAEYTFGVVVSYLYYWTKIENKKFRFIKHLESGVVLEDGKCSYLIEFDRPDLIDESVNVSSTNINIYANSAENSADELINFIYIVIEEKLEKIFKNYNIIVNRYDNKIAEIKIETIDEKIKDKINKCLDNEEIITHSNETLDKRFLHKINEQFQKDKNKVLKKLDSYFDEIKENKPKNNFTFLHLSDLHFDSLNVANKEFCILEKDLELLSNEGIKEEDVKFTDIDYIVISGDLSIKADKKEFETSTKFIEKLIEKYDLTPENILIVPGNHDYSRKVTQEAYEVASFSLNEFNPNTDYKINDKLFLKRDKKRWERRFDSFSDYIYERIYNRAYPDDLKDSIEDERFYFLLLNSSKKLDQFFSDEVELDKDDLIKCNKEEKIKICIAHHPINYFKNKIKADDFYRNLNEFNFSFYLHGHIHNSSLIQLSNFAFAVNSTISIGAGLFYAYNDKARVPGVPLRYNIFTLKIKDNKLNELILTVREREKNGTTWMDGVVFYENGVRKKVLKYKFK